MLIWIVIIVPYLSVGEPGVLEVFELACSVYKDALKRTPALVRLWWKDQDRKSVSYVDR